MKKLIVVASLFLVSAAHADTSTYYWTGKGEWTDAQLQAAAQACDQRYGPVMNGESTSARYKACMRQQGWRYQGTKRERYWIDPDTGDSCHNTGWATICEWPPR